MTPENVNKCAQDFREAIDYASQEVRTNALARWAVRYGPHLIAAAVAASDLEAHALRIAQLSRPTIIVTADPEQIDRIKKGEQ